MTEAEKIAVVRAAIEDALRYLRVEDDAPDLGELFTSLEDALSLLGTVKP